MVKKNATKNTTPQVDDSQQIVFDTSTKRVIANTSTPINMNEKIRQVREVVPEANINHVHLVLQHYEYDVERTINAFVEDGAEEALSQWSEQSSAKTKTKVNKKAKNKSKDGSGRKTDDSQPKGASVNGTNPKTNGYIYDELESSSSRASSSLPDHPPANGKPSASGNNNYSSLNRNALPSIDQLANDLKAQAQLGANGTPLPQNGPSGATALPQRQRNRQPRADAAPAQPTKEPTPAAPSKPEAPSPSPSPSVPKQQQQQQQQPRQKQKQPQQPQPPQQAPTPVGDPKSRPQSAKGAGSQSASPRVDSRPPTNSREPRVRLESSSSTGGHPLTGKKAVERSVRDLQRQTVFIQSLPERIRFETEKATKQVKDLFLQLRAVLDDRQVELFRELEKTRDQTMHVVSDRLAYASELKMESDRADSLSEDQLNLLRTKIKDFGGDHRIDQEIESMQWLTAPDLTSLAATLRTLGHVGHMKHTYTTHAPIVGVKGSTPASAPHTASAPHPANSPSSANPYTGPIAPPAVPVNALSFHAFGLSVEAPKALASPEVRISRGRPRPTRRGSGGGGSGGGGSGSSRGGGGGGSGSGSGNSRGRGGGGRGRSERR